MATTIQSGRASSPLLTADVASRAEVYGGRGLVFDGVVDQLEISDSSNLDLTNFTLSAWIKLTDVSDYRGIISKRSGNAVNYSFFVKQSEGKLGSYDGSAEINSSATVNDGNWHHVVQVHNSGTTTFYIDGSASGSGSQSFSTNSHSVLIGEAGVGQDDKFLGSICDVKIFDTALTETQVTELYLKPENTPSAIQDSIVAWYPMSEGNPESPQSIVYDHSEKGLGSELFSDTSFDNASSWHIYGGSGTLDVNTTNAGKLTAINAQDKRIQQSNILTVGKLYKITFVIDSYTDGRVRGTFDSAITFYPTGVGTYSRYFVASSNNLVIQFDGGGADMTMTDISIKEVLMGNHATTSFLGDDLVTNGTFDTDANWTKGTGWTIDVLDSNKAECDGTQTGNTSLLQTGLFTIGKTYQATFDLTRTAGNFKVLLGLTTLSGDYTTNDTHTFTGVATGNDRLYLQGDEDFIGTVDNVVVKEVGISSSGFETAVNEPVVPQVPLMKYNQKMVFKGTTGQYVDVDIDSLSLGDFTISFWYNTDNPDGTFIGRGTSSCIRFSTSLTTFRVGYSNNYYIYATTGSEIVNGRFLTATREGTSFKLYIDSVLDSTTTVVTDAWTFGNSARIGQSAWDNFDGTIHKCSVFNTALTQAQIQELFNDGVALDATTHSKADDNLLGYWRNDGVTTWTDRSDIQAIGFDGSDDYISVQDDSSLTVSTALSVSTWINHDSIGSLQAYVTNWDYPNAGRSYRLYYSSGIKVELSAGGANDTKNITASFTPVVGLWYHIAFTFDSGTVKVYINGESQTVTADASMHTSLYSSNGVTLIGAVGNESTNAHHMNGKIGQTAIYSSVLSEDDILGIYNLGRRNANLSVSYPTNLIGYWLLNPTHSNPDLTGSNKILDRSTNSNHGTQNGGVSFLGANDGDVQGTPDSITIREGLNSNKDGLGFPLTNPSSNVLRLNGESEYLHIENDLLAGKPTGTISFWAKTSSTGNQAILGYHRDQWSIRLNKTTILFGVGGTTVTASSSLDNSGWGFHAITFDQGTAKFYKLDLDTPLYHTSTDYLSAGDVAFPSNTNGVFIGKRNHASAYFYNGLVDEVRIYDRVLTLDELTKNYKHQKGKHKND